jgi:hypothetical protein
MTPLISLVTIVFAGSGATKQSRLPFWRWIASAVALRLWRTRRFARKDGFHGQRTFAGCTMAGGATTAVRTR